MKTKVKKDCRPTCCECGGTNVETCAWVEYREDMSERVVNSEGPLFGEEANWCHDCDCNVELDYPKTPASVDRDRLQNQAAREHGPELLAALIALLEEADLGEVDEDTRPIVEAARSVISKVTTGREAT